MFTEFHPTFRHVVLSMFINITVGVCWAYAPTDRLVIVFLLAWILTFVIVLAILLMMTWDRLQDFWRTVGESASKLDRMAPDRFAALGIAFPNVRLKWTGSKAELYYEDTNVPFRYFDRFLAGSDSRQVFPKRYCREGHLPEWAWDEILINLQERGYVVPDSAAGSHSWLWVNATAYERVMKHYRDFLSFVVGRLNRQEGTNET